MKILFVEPYYEPDGGPAAPLFTMLCQRLAQLGHQVTVLTAVPHYPTGQVPPAFRRWRSTTTTEAAVRVIRVPLPSVDRSSMRQRLWQFGAFQLRSVIRGWREQCDVFVSVTPSLEVWLPFTYFSRVRKRPAVYSVHDVYPDSGIQLGVFSDKRVVQLVTKLEQACAGRAGAVRILSESFRSGVERLGVSSERIRLIYDWVDTDLIVPLSRSNAFAIENRLEDKMVVMYAGNVGFSQNLSVVLMAARELTSTQFVIVGDGPAKKDLVAEARKSDLPNVTFLPFQERSRLPEVLATADVSLVSLQQGMGFNSLPSKTLSILASGRPIVASIDAGSDTWKLIERSGAGICVEPTDTRGLIQALESLSADSELRREMGRRGREYAVEYHSPDSAARAFEALLHEAIMAE